MIRRSEDASSSWRELPVHVSLRHVGLVLAIMTGFFTVVGLAIAVAKFSSGYVPLYGLYDLFDVSNNDSSIPAWYASLTLLLCSMLLALHAIASTRIKDRRAPYWRVLALIFLLLSLDEVARVHEVVGGFIGDRLIGYIGGGGLFHFEWVLPGGILAGVAVIGFVHFVLGLPRGVRYGVVAARVMFIGGAIFAEMLNAHWASVHGTQNLRYDLGSVFEEFLEMAGVALSAHVLARYLGRRTSMVAMQMVFDNIDRVAGSIRRSI